MYNFTMYNLQFIYIFIILYVQFYDVQFTIYLQFHHFTIYKNATPKLSN